MGIEERNTTFEQADGKTKDAFVIMPFSTTTTCTAEDWSDTFQHVFRPAFTEVGYLCERAQATTGGLVDSIVGRLRNARVVLADVTDRNPNVFYELGVRHALRKGTIIVSRDGQVPSDLGGLWYLKYGTKPGQVAEFKREIRRLVEYIESDPEKPDNPVATYLNREGLANARVVNMENTKKISALMTELSGNALILRGMLDHQEKADRLSVGCLDLLCTTHYLDLGPRLLAEAYELRSRCNRLEDGRPVDIQQLLTRLESLGGSMLSIHERLVRGEYSEPAAVSLMEWYGAPTPASAGASNACRPLFAKDPPFEVSRYATDKGDTMRIDSPSEGHCPTCRMLVVGAFCPHCGVAINAGGET